MSSEEILLDLLAFSKCRHFPSLERYVETLDVTVFEKVIPIIDQKQVLVARKQYDRHCEKIRQLLKGLGRVPGDYTKVMNLLHRILLAKPKRCKDVTTVRKYLKHDRHYEEYSEILCLLRRLADCGVKGAIVCVDKTFSWNKLELFLKNEVEQRLRGRWSIERSSPLVEYDNTKVLYIRKERS